MRGRSANLPRESILRTGARSGVAAAMVAAMFVAVGPATPAVAQSAPVAQPTLVSPVPAAFSPSINDGTVFALAQVGGHIIAGGNFTTESPAGDTATVLRQASVVSFNAQTGELDSTGFRPNVNGQVNDVVPGPGKHQVYVAGTFSKVNGKSMRVALLNTRNGHIVTGWNPPAFNLGINKVVLADGRLFAGGSFTSVGGRSFKGLVALDPHTGKPTSYLNLPFTGHHNYKRQCNPSRVTCAEGRPGVRGLAVNPAGTRLVVTGNFTSAAGRFRDQVAMVDLGAHAAAVDPQWATEAYTARCLAQSFDSYIRDVTFSPDGTYFVIAASGGIGTNTDGSNSSCDAAARFNTSSKGSNVRPQWIAYTGADSIWTAAITGTTVYVGGHQRWLNNRYGQDVAGPGAVPRPGLAALNPKNGLPYSWNPGRNPRGAGCFALLATKAGLWIGSDTDYIGDHNYLRPKVAFFPLAGGEHVPADSPPQLPGRVFEVGDVSASATDPGRLDERVFDGSTAGTQQTTSFGVDWSDVRGGFLVDGELFYGKAGGGLWERSFDGTTLGPETLVAPYDDPNWRDAQTGSGQTYEGSPSTLEAEIPTLSSMFFYANRIYYTIAGATTMFWRDFEPESGVVGAVEHSLSDGKDWSGVAGAFASGSRLYFADKASGVLESIAWSSSGATGQPRVVDTHTDWASNSLFVLSQKDAPTVAPTAEFTASCSSAGKCQFAANPWTDPDGGVVRYGWSFGDGTKQKFSTSTAATHRYVANGTRKVTLVVIDTAGAVATSTHQVTINAPVKKISFVGSTAAASRKASVKVKVPKQVKAHDGLLLYAATSGGVPPSTPTGWARVGTISSGGLTTAVYDRYASRHDARSKVAVRVATGQVTSVVLAAYRNTSSQLIEQSVFRTISGTRTPPTPDLHRLRKGSWVVGAWSEIAKHRSSWQVPHGMKQRARASASRRPFTSSVVGDSRGPVAGSFRTGSVRASVRPIAAAQWAIALAPALA